MSWAPIFRRPKRRGLGYGGHNREAIGMRLRKLRSDSGEGKKGSQEGDKTLFMMCVFAILLMFVFWEFI